MMAKKQAGKTGLPGLEYDRFEAAVNAMVALRDEGEFLVFLSHLGEVRFIGSTEKFRSRWASEMAVDSLAENEASKALAELGDFIRNSAAFPDADRLVSFLETSVLESTFKGLDEAAKSTSRELLRKKAKVVSERLLTAALRQRAERLDTVAGPLLDDLDTEVVSVRQDELTGRRVSTPFLRLRLRYSSRHDTPFPFNVGGVVGMGVRMPAGLSRSFEFEADETDIDLLMRRLGVAKDLLLKAMDMKLNRKE